MIVQEDDFLERNQYSIINLPNEITHVFSCDQGGLSAEIFNYKVNPIIQYYPLRFEVGYSAIH